MNVILLQIVDPNEVEVSIDAAIISGYRHIDTAFGYKNEAAIGKCLSKWIQGGSPNGEVVTRDELFLVTKVRLNQEKEAEIKMLTLVYELSHSFSATINWNAS